MGAAFERSGIGLHSGITTTVRVLPAAAGMGRYFVRVDLPGKPMIPARVEAVSTTMLSTQLRAGKGETSADSEVTVRTVEHLLAALAGSGVDDACIEIDGPEVPLLDGSALAWIKAIQEVGMVESERPQHSSHLSFLASPIVIEEPIWICQDDAFVAALPAPITRFTYGIDFENPAIGNQWHSWTPEQEHFADAIAPARTFGLANQVDQLRDRGLIKGGSLENALVCGDHGWLNPPLRFSNEPVRHKLLDLVGDLSLLGKFPVAHVLAYKASHTLHIQLARLLAQQIGAGDVSRQSSAVIGN
ncbi:UDP-3-0-acyl N-acetylglucosamine deacetylase [Coleofasciculus chthonoplastes PCC 7420]|uniref:UDP-3-O-acyl-N-acetylglucosamine deacetylase n=1 Tax=Coleofasciculus chthonoplastes PCC 7420 TaxID=118168 RepID=B4VY38_9CYAN|nr:UDP-3-0-acyl N-acetylglucosamine deacetylase [Coleofasciculus chthonoplastes PCC 7420]